MLDHIFSGNTREEIVEMIHESLRELRQQMDDRKIATEKFLISKVSENDEISSLLCATVY